MLLAGRYPEVVVHSFEVRYDRENRVLLEAFADAFGRPVSGVPVTFIGEDAWVGFHQVVGQQMRASVEAYRAYAAPDAADRLRPAAREGLLAVVAPPAPTLVELPCTAGLPVLWSNFVHPASSPLSQPRVSARMGEGRSRDTRPEGRPRA